MVGIYFAPYPILVERAQSAECLTLVRLTDRQPRMAHTYCGFLSGLCVGLPDLITYTLTELHGSFTCQPTMG